MARLSIRTLGPFMGLFTSVDPRDIPDGYAQDLLNVRIEDGQMALRYGATTQGNGPGSVTAEYGIHHAIGYDSSTLDELDEFIAFLTKSGNTRAYSYDPNNSYTATEIKNGVASVNLHASDWTVVNFRDKAYLINPNNSAAAVYEHTIEDEASLTAITPPAKPTAALTFRPKYSSTSYTTYDRIDFTGITMTNASQCACTGSLDWGAGANTPATNQGSQFVLGYVFPYNTSPGQGAGTATIDLTAGGHAVYDWTYNDIFSFVLRVDGVEIDPGTIKFSVINNDGSPITITADELEAKIVSDGQVGGTTIYHVWAKFKNKTRGDWDNIKHIKLEATYIDGTGFGTGYLTFGEFRIGCVPCEQVPEGVVRGIDFSYSYQVSSSAQESERVGKYIGSTAYPLFVPNTALEGKPAQGMETRPLGAWIEFGITASSDGGVDRARLYAQEQNGLHVVVTQDDATSTYLYRMTIEELRALATAVAAQGTFSNMKYAFPFKGGLVWLKKGGENNVEFSRIGEALRLASDLDEADDENRGRRMSLAPSLGDEPVCGFDAGNAVIVCGKYGVYASIGNRPSEMTPFKRVPGSKGVANMYAACRWRDASGNPGVAFLSANLDGVYFVQVDQSFDGDQGFTIQELSAPIRPSVKTWLSATTARMAVDENKDALWVGTSTMSLILRRPSSIDGNRQWERYSTGATYFATGDGVKYGLIGLVGAGAVKLLDDPDASGGNVFKGTDFSSTSAGCYWHSKAEFGPTRRVMHVRPFPDFPAGGTNGPSVSMWFFNGTTTVGTSGKVPNVDAGTPASTPRKTYRFGPSTKGKMLSFRVNMNSYTSGSGPLFRQMEIEEIGPLKSRYRDGT